MNLPILEPAVVNSKADYFVSPNQYASYIGCDGRQFLDALWQVTKKGLGVVFEGKRHECVSYCENNHLCFAASGVNVMGTFM